MSTLILLGAAGGLLRGVVDLYIQFENWRSARGAHQRDQLSEQERPRLAQYFDPAVDLTAAGVHSVMGAGIAVLFGTTGQISGPYAAIVVGASAPVLLTQLARIQSVSEALGGGQAGADPGAPQSPAPFVPSVPSVVQSALPDPGAAALPPDSEAVRPQPAAPQTHSAAFRHDEEASRPQPNGRPADPGHGPGRVIPPRRDERAVGEEGRP
ncbi:hypothetical protein [Streptomyces sp. NPDC058867]|uniref:hypothetical protein n=1 Tax=unclassified Streptomyces TaxID=2593676 RepID=UPI0036A7FDD9